MAAKKKILAGFEIKNYEIFIKWQSQIYTKPTFCGDESVTHPPQNKKNKKKRKEKNVGTYSCPNMIRKGITLNAMYQANIVLGWMSNCITPKMNVGTYQCLIIIRKDITLNVNCYVKC